MAMRGPSGVQAGADEGEPVRRRRDDGGGVAGGDAAGGDDREADGIADLADNAEPRGGAARLGGGLKDRPHL